MGKVVKAVTNPLGVLGNKDIVGGAKNLLFGKKVGPTNTILNPEDYEMKKNAVSMYNRGLQGLMQDQVAARLGRGARAQTNLMLRQNRQNTEDAQRRLSQLQAQRGMGNSSIGLGQALGLERDAIQRMGDIRSSEDARRRAEKTRASQALVNAASFGAGRTIDRRITEGGRKGGIAPLVGAGLGAAFGGPQGAQLGMSLGNAAQTMF